MEKHFWLQTLLFRTGISQADFAIFLQISRSTVNMACRRVRSLPTSANLQLIKIEQTMETQPPGPGSPFTSYASLSKHFRLQARERRYEAAVMERYMEKYDRKMQQWEQRERFWRAAGSVVPQGPPGKRQAEWLVILQALQRFPPSQPDKQYYRYKAQLPLLLLEAETYEKWVMEWEKE